jgi:flagellar basal-body rod protein FlgF
MIYGIYHSAAGGIAQSAKLDVISNNLANINTPGFRKDFITFRDRLAESYEDKPDFQYRNRILDKMGGGLFIDRTFYQRDPGPVAATGAKLDVAINGSGFFTVRQNDKTYYTRAGNFAVDRTGRLCTADLKYAVTNANGDEIIIARPEDAEIDPQGNIWVAGENVGRLGVAEFANPEQLRKFGDNLFEYMGTDAPAASTSAIEQGALELSSVNPVTEMVDMISAMRAYEANITLARAQDGTLDRVANDVGRVQR